MVHHPTSKYFVLTDKTQALVDADSQVRAKEGHCKYGVSQFQDLPEDDDPRWNDPFPKDRVDVINPTAEVQKAKGLTPITTKSEEIM